MALFTTIIIGCWLVFLGYWFVSALQAKKNVHPTMKGLWIRIILAFIVILILQSKIFNGIEPQGADTSLNPIVDIIGSILTIAGVTFAIWARYHLGKNWGMPMSVKEKPELVRSGPYEYVRHPIYTGVLVAIFGSLLIAGSWWIIIFVAASSYFLYSAYQEEKLLMQQFPADYPKYKNKTKMIIPFLW